jgi:hypothetical protein
MVIRFYAEDMHTFIAILSIFAFMTMALFWRNLAKPGTVERPPSQKRLARK